MYNNKQIYRIMRKFYNFSTYEVYIIDYLMQKNKIIETTYSNLTNAIGLDKQKNTSNVRKAILHLQKLGVVDIIYKHKENECKTKTNPMKACFINDNWLNNILYNYDI